MRRRLGESCGTWPLYGPPISSDEMMSGVAGYVAFAAPDRNAGRSQPLGLDRVGLEDGRDHLPEAGLHRDAHLQRVIRVSTGRRFASPVVRRGLGRQFGPAAQRELPDSRAIDANLDLRSARSGRGSRPA